MQNLIRNVHPVVASFPQAATSIAGDYISLKNFAGVTIVIMVDVTSGTDTGAVTLTQASAVAGTGAKALSFDYQWSNLDTETADALTKTAVTSDTFDAGGVTKSCLYVIEVKAEDLDVDNGFDCLRANLATVTNGNSAILYLLHTPRYISEDGAKSAIVD